MNKTLLFLVLVVIVLSYKFIFSSSTVEYTDSAKVLQGISMALPYKNIVFKHWQSSGEILSADDWQSMKDKPEIDISQSLVESIELTEEGPGVISIYFINKPVVPIETDISGTRILLKPYLANDKLKWLCEGTMPADLLPRKCTAEVNVEQE